MDFLNGTIVTWLGHATVLITTKSGVNLLIDPFIEGNPKYPKGFELPKKIDYILLSHAHSDHTADALPVAKKHGSTIVAIFELANYMEGKGAKSTIGMNIGGTLELKDGVSVSMTDAKHSSSVADGKDSLYLGSAAGFVITVADGPVLYHAGDTTVFRDMDLIRELYAPDVAMLPIGGHFTMAPREAALAVRFLSPKVVLPIHWGTMPQLIGTPEELAKILGDSCVVAMLNPGEALSAKG